MIEPIFGIVRWKSLARADAQVVQGTDEFRNTCTALRDVVLKAIEVSEDGLQFADEKFHYDREIVLKAVKHHGASLGYVLNKDFLNDQEIALEAVKSFDYGVLDYVSEKLLSNKEFVIKIIKARQKWMILSSYSMCVEMYI